MEADEVDVESVIASAADQVENDYVEGQPPRKKQKTEGFFGYISNLFSMDQKEYDDQQIMMERNELKLILKKYPKLDVSEEVETAEYVRNMTDEQVHDMYQASKLKLGEEIILPKIIPENNGENAISLLGQILSIHLGLPDLQDEMIHDTRLITAANQLIPSLQPKLSLPMEIFGRISYHIMSQRKKIKTT